MRIDSPKSLFLHELADMYDGEQQIVEILPKLAREVDHEPLRDAFQEHERQTNDQIRNLERCFELMSGRRGDAVCHVVRALSHEHEMMTNQDPPQELLTLYDMAAASKTEHFEIAAYQDLIASAQSLGESEVLDLLQKNLRQEQEMAQKIQRLRQSYRKEIGQKQSE